MRGRVAWKSKNSSGSICAKRVAPSEAPKKRSAADAASPASFHPVNAQTSAGALSPSGRLSQIRGCIKRTVAPSASRSIIMGSWPPIPDTPGPEAQTIATLRAGDEVRGRPGVHAQGAPRLARRHAVPRARAARPHRRDPRRASSATPTSRPRASSAATSSGSRAASSASATSCSSTSARSPAAPRPRPTRPRSCRPPTATSTSSTASSSTSRARSTTRVTPACSRCCSATARCARSGAARRARARGHHAYLGGLLEHTVAVGTLALEACQLHPRLNRDLLITAALVHDLGKTEEFTYGAEIGISDGRPPDRPRRAGPAPDRPPRGPCRRPGRGAAPRARPLRADPPRRRRRPPVRLSGGDRPVPAERARRGRQGRARVRGRARRGRVARAAPGRTRRRASTTRTACGWRARESR